MSREWVIVSNRSKPLVHQLIHGNVRPGVNPIATWFIPQGEGGHLPNDRVT